MSTVLRYRNPVVCEHLASQYVAGHLSPRVRRRMEALFIQHPPLAEAVALWSQLLAPLHDTQPKIAPPRSLWPRIASAMQPEMTPPKRGGWATHGWRWWSAFSTSMALVLGLMLFWQEPPTVTAWAPSYMAPLSAGEQVQVVVYGYAAEAGQASQLRVQWAVHEASARPAGPLHIWAEHREDGSLVYLGELAAGKTVWDLSPERWQALISSGRLLVVPQADRFELANVLLEGPCIQLKPYVNI